MRIDLIVIGAIAYLIIAIAIANSQLYGNNPPRKKLTIWWIRTLSVLWPVPLVFVVIYVLIWHGYEAFIKNPTKP